jgi:hypothetical protein
MLVLLPDSPATAKFLSPVQRDVLQARVQTQQHSSNNSGKYKSSQIKEALLDPKSWLFSFFIFSTSAPSGALSNVSQRRYLILFLLVRPCPTHFYVIKMAKILFNRSFIAS